MRLKSKRQIRVKNAKAFNRKFDDLMFSFEGGIMGDTNLNMFEGSSNVFKNKKSPLREARSKKAFLRSQDIPLSVVHNIRYNAPSNQGKNIDIATTIIPKSFIRSRAAGLEFMINKRVFLENEKIKVNLGKLGVSYSLSARSGENVVQGNIHSSYFKSLYKRMIKKENTIAYNLNKMITKEALSDDLAIGKGRYRVWVPGDAEKGRKGRYVQRGVYKGNKIAKLIRLHKLYLDIHRYQENPSDFCTPGNARCETYVNHYLESDNDNIYDHLSNPVQKLFKYLDKA